MVGGFLRSGRGPIRHELVQKPLQRQPLLIRESSRELLLVSRYALTQALENPPPAGGEIELVLAAIIRCIDSPDEPLGNAAGDTLSHRRSIQTDQLRQRNLADSRVMLDQGENAYPIRGDFVQPELLFEAVHQSHVRHVQVQPQDGLAGGTEHGFNEDEWRNTEVDLPGSRGLRE